MDWTVVIPSADAENLRCALEAIVRTHPQADPRRIIVVDDGACAQGGDRFRGDHWFGGVRWIDGVKPFVFARNVNRGIAASPESHVFIIMGDDVEPLTIGAFDVLAQHLSDKVSCGIVSPGVLGVIGNERQRFTTRATLIDEPQKLAFVCVAISRRVWERVGVLDERFVGYGCEDDDYSWRTRRAGYSLSILPSIAVRHDGTLPSTFRSRPDQQLLFQYNRELFLRKWKMSNATPAPTEALAQATPPGSVPSPAPAPSQTPT